MRTATVRGCMEGEVRLSEACQRGRGPSKPHEKNQKYRYDLRRDLIGSGMLLREGTNRTVGSTDSFALKTDTLLKLLVRYGERRNVRREGETFYVVGKVVSDHRVQCLGHRLDDGRLEDIACVSPDTGLTRGT